MPTFTSYLLLTGIYSANDVASAITETKLMMLLLQTQKLKRASMCFWDYHPFVLFLLIL